jgi:hypothetical protein
MLCPAALVLPKFRVGPGLTHVHSPASGYADVQFL